MKIDRVILAVDNNKKYSVYWNIVSKVYFEKFNIKPTLIFYGSEQEFAENNFIVDVFDYLILNRLDSYNDPSPNWVVTWSLFWGASKYINDVCLLSGIDQIPIGDLFFKEVEKYSKDNFIIGFSDAYKKYNKDTLGYFNTSTNLLYPSSHLVGTGEMFKKIFEIEDEFSTEISKVYSKRNRYYLNNNFYKDSKLWGIDECYASDKLSNYKNNIVELNLFWNYWIKNRIDLDNNNNNIELSIDKIKNREYSEITCKNYDVYKNIIDNIINEI